VEFPLRGKLKNRYRISSKAKSPDEEKETGKDNTHIPVENFSYIFTQK
jgi:hypothetical protein